jgi:prepilin peptidase CpaA
VNGVEAAFDLVRVVLMFVTVAVAAVTDTMHRRVHNVLTYPAAALGLALGFGMGGVGLDEPITRHTLLSHLAGLCIGFGIFLIPWWMRAVKGGEVKLAAAIGALAGFPFVIPAIFWSTVVGAIMGLWIHLMQGGALMTAARRSLRYAFTLRAPDAPTDPKDPALVTVPYAVAMAFGTVWAFYLFEVRLANA